MARRQRSLPCCGPFEMMRRGLIIIALLAAAPVHADDVIYVELLGKGGVYGVGYEHTITPWLAIGAAGSFSVLGRQQVATIAPYVHATIVQRRAHALFGELGAILAHSRIPSPVPDWKGMSDTGGGGFLSLGYEHASRHVVVRASGGVAAGEGGLGPMIGISIGARP